MHKFSRDFCNVVYDRMYSNLHRHMCMIVFYILKSQQMSFFLCEPETITEIHFHAFETMKELSREESLSLFVVENNEFSIDIKVSLECFFIFKHKQIICKKNVSLKTSLTNFWDW